MIVKIQKPLESSLEDPPALVYNEDGSYEEFVKFSEGLRMAMGDRLKIYVEATVEDGKLRLIQEVPAQSW
jgi:hypothetical protein